MKKPSKQALAVAEEIQSLFEEFAPEVPKLPPAKRKREVRAAALAAEKVVTRIEAKRLKEKKVDAR